MINGFEPNNRSVKVSINGFEPNNRSVKASINGFEPNNRSVKVSINGFEPNSRSVKVSINGFEPNSRSVKVSVNGFEPNNRSVKVSINGFEPNNRSVSRYPKFVTVAERVNIKWFCAQLQISEGRVRVLYNLGDGEQRLELSGAPASDGQWHTVNAKRYLQQMTLTLDGGEGRNYNFSRGNANGKVNLIIQRLIFAGASVSYSQEIRVLTGDLTESK